MSRSASSNIIKLRKHPGDEPRKVTLEGLTCQLDEDRDLAHRTDNPAAAIKATMAKAQLYGFLTEQAKARNLATEPEPKKLSNLEMARRFAFILEAAEHEAKEIGEVAPKLPGTANNATKK